MEFMKNGTTRTVFLISKYAVKIPSFFSWKMFLHGLLANMQEASFSKTKWPELCPVLFELPGGFLIVQKRAEPIDAEEYYSLSFYELTIRKDYIVPAEDKPNSWGKINGKIVAIDYGS